MYYNPLLLTDFYKVHHHRMYPEGTTKIYSNLTARKSRLKGVNQIVFFGLQHFIKDYLIEAFNENFFKKSWKDIREEYYRHTQIDLQHIEALYELGYLPLEIKALKEGTLCPIGVPCLTVTNTHPDFFWLVNYIETLLSCTLWQSITSATIANEYRKLLNSYALRTTGTVEGVQWQGHDFSMRGMSSVESAILSGMGHLTSFTGTDTIPAIYQLERSYNASGLIGGSVPATEHSVQCMYGKEDEVGAFRRLLSLYPTGILSVVSDTWDLWKVCTEYLPILKEEILSRDGKLVIRPDSGDPVDIICGTFQWDSKEQYDMYNGENPDTSLEYIEATDEQSGVIDLLWEVFGGTINEYGYKVLDPHIGTIYGDSITLERAEEICRRLEAKGFASTNIVFGVGSYTYQYNTRDTFGFAMKATYGEVNHVGKEIFKDPVTDDGTKKSKKGLLQVVTQYDTSKGKIKVNDQVSWEDEKNSFLETVFLNGKLVRQTTLDEVRERIKDA